MDQIKTVKTASLNNIHTGQRNRSPIRPSASV